MAVLKLTDLFSTKMSFKHNFALRNMFIFIFYREWSLFFFMKNNISKRSKRGPQAISNLREKHPRRMRGDEIEPSQLQRATQWATLLDKKFTLLGTKMKVQKDMVVRAAFKSEKNGTKKQGGKAYRVNRASIGMILLIVQSEDISFSYSENLNCFIH